MLSYLRWRYAGLRKTHGNKVKNMKKILLACLVTGLLGSAITASAHSGGTDAYGCHTNHTTGGYHCH